MDTKIDKVADQLQRQLKQLKETVTPGVDTGDTETILAEFERKMMEALDGLKSELTSLKNVFLKQSEELDRKSFADSLIIHGIAEVASEDLYVKVCDIVKTKINVAISKDDLSLCYRVGKKLVGADKGRPVAVKFVRRWKRNEVFNNKRKLKGSGVTVSEMLTRSVQQLFKLVKQYVDKKRCWTRNGNVYITTDEGRKRIDGVEDIPGYHVS